MTSPPRIAYLVSAYPAVSHTFIEREIRALRARGVTIDTFSIRRQPEHILLHEQDRQAAAETFNVLPVAPRRLLGAHLRALRTRPRTYLATLRRALGMSAGGARATLWQLFYFAEAVVVWDECRRREIGHIHAHFANVACAVAMLAGELGAPDGMRWSFTMHGSTEFEDVTRYALAEKAGRATFVACISDFCRSQLMRLIDPDRWDKLAIVRCGLDPALIPPLETRQAGVPLRVLCVGRLVPEKGQHVLVHAAADLRRRGIAIELVLAGGGAEQDALRRAAAALGLSEAVRLPGALGQGELAELYREADIFCLPSFAEGLPVVLMEAMAHGLPVVTTRIAGVAELVTDGESGIVLAPGRVDLLADALASLAGDPDLRERLGRAGHEVVAREFRVTDSAERLERLFASAAAH